MDITELYQCFLQCDGVSTDTRSIQPNSLFFALKGDSFDANLFAQEALNNGAAYVVMDNKKLVTDPTKMLYVADSLGALQQLAKHHRQQLGLPIIALTGSNGKTTSKELIAAVLSKKYKIAATKGNLNNHIGVPLTLLSISEDTDLGIIEMGANHKQEIAMLCEIADPDFGYITNFGKAHLDGFGGFEGVIKAKSELYDYLEDNHKTAFVNIDDPRQDAKTITFNRFTFGSDDSADIVIDKLEAQPNATVYYKGESINSNLTGIYNATNIAAALTIGDFFNVELHDIKNAIEQYIPTNNRSQWIIKDQSMILLDAYNANPSSMDAVLTNFDHLKDDRDKVFILGDMLELGQEGLKEHKDIIERIDKVNNKTAYFIGKEFAKAAINTNYKNIFYFESFDLFKKHIQDVSNEAFLNKLILIKGSRGIALERALELI
ncbi:UDP-N-acetylmuramoyl-tripeptide--D-alanyl-D-alanine ligase [Myroides sp. M-43]|uniref:UDP-N-acetylmuramoyl-tripeptide--D-alanyl-D- alanine ligase n=1 Tax=Myroides oncorhynchi TaxID=2893756 RepID=UPI001E42EF25|nr:UDP-N-acetylmuramoyl-tripeptide--D-alanyl-D-alanine ligase [Myroides oncorhynchi]MCC9041489.1 UDP-N-acetylmuramoyl-tripeptide--D-alanyl-D-alanine ligase [Myroides oncorhynchi]